MLKWIAIYKDNSTFETDYAFPYSTQERFRQINKNELKRFTWIIRGIEFSLDCIKGEFCIDGKTIKPDFAVENCGVGLVAFIRAYKDLNVGRGGVSEGIEGVCVGYKEYRLDIDYQTLKWEIHKNRVE